MTVGALVTSDKSVLALEPLLHDVHVQEPEEAAAEAEAERGRDFGLVMQRRVVQLELLQRVAEGLVLVGLDRKQPREHARLHRLEAGQRLVAGTRFARDGVADRRAVDVLDPGGHPADFAGGQRVRRDALRREAADAVDLPAAAGRHDLDAVIRLAVHRS